MSQIDKTHWIINNISDTAQKTCKKSLSLLKTEKPSEFEAAVPEIRKNYKKIRASIRLVRDDYDNYKKENEFYRDEAKKVLSVQQAIAMVKAIDLINEQYSDRLYKNAFTELREKLENHKKKQIDTALDEEHIFQDLHQNLKDKCESLKDDLSKQISQDVIESGLKKVYQRGRKAQKNLSDSKTNEDFHELQKRVNYLDIQLGILSPIWPDMIRIWQSELEKLSQLLVTSEALYQLSGFLQTYGDMGDKNNGVYLMNTLVEGHREQVQQHALLLAQKIYSLKPKHLLKFITAALDANASESAQQILPVEKLKLSE